MKTTKIQLVLILLLGLVSCEKKEIEPHIELKYLSQNEWHLDKVIAYDEKGKEIDITNALPNLKDIDYKYYYNENDTLYMTTKYQDDEPELMKLNWWFDKNDSTILKVGIGDDSFWGYRIVHLDAENLEYNPITEPEQTAVYIFSKIE